MKVLLACLAALPFAGHAQEQSETLFLEYEGVVTSVDPAPWWDYKSGDLVKGLVKVHPDLAPSPIVFGNRLAEYSRGGPGPDWVVSKLIQGSRHGDAAHVLFSGGLDDPDIYSVSDHDFGATPHRFQISVEDEGLNADIGLVQSFDRIPAKDGSKAWATLEGYLNSVGRAVQFALTRVSLTPGMCRPN